LPAIPDREANEVFQSLAIFKVGNGEKIFFWKDRWINGRSVEDIAPEVAALVTTRRKNARKIAGALPNNTWFTDIQGELSLEGWVECIMLSEEIERVEVDPSVPNVIAWKGSSTGVYSAKATYNMLCQGNITWQMAGPIWRCFAPLKCKIFGWLAIKYRLWTSDRRTRHGLQDSPHPCATCLQSEDNVDHILVQCPYARIVWFGCLRNFGLNLPEPQQHANLERWWTEARKRVRKEDRRWFDTLVLLAAWTIWKQRNARVFGNLHKQLSPEQMIATIKEELYLWRSARVGGSVGVGGSARMSRE
jgi:hypothetical protein